MLITFAVFSRKLFAIALRRPEAPSVIKGLISIFRIHAYVANTILTEKGKYSKAEVQKQTMGTAGVNMGHKTINHALSSGMIERDHQNLEMILKINVSADQLQEYQNKKISVITHNTTYHASLNCSTTEIFQDRTPHSELELKSANLLRTTCQPRTSQRL